MPAKSIVVATKNQFFSYFSVDGGSGVYRERNQLWTAEGITMKVQGDLPPGAAAGALNSFGKKHLLSTEGSSKTQTAAEKAAKILKKRQAAKDGGINPTANRQGKLETIKKEIGGDTKARHASATGHFELKAYGDQKTNRNTMILLDEFDDLNAVATCFAKAIKAKTDWATNAKQAIHVALEPGSVMTIENGTTSYASGVEVEVYFDGGTPAVYHIFHLGGTF